MTSKKEDGKGQDTANKAPESGHITHTKAAQEATRLIDRKYQEAKAMEQAGNPVAWLYYGPPREILRCFDILDLYPENFGATTAIRGTTSPYLEYSEELGLTTAICSYHRIALGYCRALVEGQSVKHLPYGGLARPSMFITSSRMCDPRVKFFELARRYFDVPIFMYDYQSPPLEDLRINDRKACQHYVNHFVEGLKELIRFLEGQTRKKLDRDQLTEAVRNSIEMWHLFHDITEMRKNSPCPLPSEDFLIVCRPYLDMTGEAEAVQFYRAAHQEMKERIRSGISVVPQEKYRLLWLGLPTWLDMEILNYMESKGAVVVMENHLHPDPPIEVDLSDPLRALAEKWLWGWDLGGSNGSQVRCGSITGGNHILELCREYNIDGVIAHSVISCRAVSIGMKHMSRLLHDEMEMPVLYLESDMSDPRAYSRSEAREKVDALIHIMESRR